MKLKKKKAFSLAEALIFLLIACLAILATMPLITVKHLNIPSRAPHGKWACKLINGEMYSATAANVNAKLPDYDKWKKGCVFPVLPANVSYIIVQAIGGGASGGYGGLNIYMDSNVKELFPSGKDNSEFLIENTGKYDVFFAGDVGVKGRLFPSSLDVILNGFKKQSCFFETVDGGSKIPYVSFSQDFKRGDKLILKLSGEDLVNKMNNNAEHLCNSTQPVMASWINSAGEKFTEPYYFQVVNHEPGNNGKTRKLVLQKEEGLQEDIVEIKGTGGGYYASSSDACSIDCSKRYVGLNDRTTWELDDYVKPLTSFSLSKGFSSTSVSKIISQGYSISYYGGCGGSSGQVNTIVMEKPSKPDITIKIGKGGVDSGDGEDTVFDYIVAGGGRGCASAVLNTSINGTDGQNAGTVAVGDSIAGKGGIGKLKKPLPSTEERNGKNAEGLGAGGGGGSFSFNINKPVEDFMNNSSIYQLEDYKVLGRPGNGSSGGVIVSW